MYPISESFSATMRLVDGSLTFALTESRPVSASRLFLIYGVTVSFISSPWGEDITSTDATSTLPYSLRQPLNMMLLRRRSENKNRAGFISFRVLLSVSTSLTLTRDPHYQAASRTHRSHHWVHPSISGVRFRAYTRCRPLPLLP